MNSTTEDPSLWLIYSRGHKAWWKKNLWGYTQDRNEAGRFTYAESMEILWRANWQNPNEPQETMVPAWMSDPKSVPASQIEALKVEMD